MSNQDPTEFDSTKLVSSVKRNCRMCAAYKNFQPYGKERAIVLASLDQLYQAYAEQYNALRKADARENPIMQAKQNKGLCLDVIDTCNHCDKEFDRAGRTIVGLKK